MFNILHRVGIKSSSDKIFEALTDEKGLAGWWSRNVTALAVVGAVDKFRCGDSGFNDMKVMELVQGSSSNGNARTTPRNGLAPS